MKFMWVWVENDEWVEREWVGHVGNRPTQLWEVWESLVSDSHSHSDADSEGGREGKPESFSSLAAEGKKLSLQ